MRSRNFLLKKVTARSKHEDGEIISPIFLRKKPDGYFRLIINLRKLNKNVDKKDFKMEIITSILKLATPKTYFTKIHLKDAYYTIPIATEHQKYLKLSHRNDLYQFTFLLDQYCHGPRKSTKSLKRPLSTLRLDGVTIGVSLDDWINMNFSF